jgi:hypothetical protein
MYSFTTMDQWNGNTEYAFSYSRSGSDNLLGCSNSTSLHQFSPASDTNLLSLYHHRRIVNQSSLSSSAVPYQSTPSQGHTTVTSATNLKPNTINHSTLNIPVTFADMTPLFLDNHLQLMSQNEALANFGGYIPGYNSHANPSQNIEMNSIILMDPTGPSLVLPLNSEAIWRNNSLKLLELQSYPFSKGILTV